MLSAFISSSNLTGYIFTILENDWQSWQKFTPGKEFPKEKEGYGVSNVTVTNQVLHPFCDLFGKLEENWYVFFYQIVVQL